MIAGRRELGGPVRDRSVRRTNPGARHQSGQVNQRLPCMNELGAAPAIGALAHILGCHVNLAESLEPAHQRANHRRGKIDSAAMLIAIGTIEPDQDALNGIEQQAMPL